MVFSGSVYYMGNMVLNIIWMSVRIRLIGD